MSNIQQPSNSTALRGRGGRRAPFFVAGFAALAALALAVPHRAGMAQTAPALPAGDKLFIMQCAACHSTVAGETRVGPSLHHIFGRAAGAEADFAYSDALRQRGADGLIWTTENLDAWLADSGAFVPGSVMNFHQADPQKRAAIVGYLAGLK